MKKDSVFTKVVTFILIVALIFTTTPPVFAFANDSGGNPAAGEAEPAIVEVDPDAYILGEFESRRESDVKVFLDSQGLYRAEVYASPVHIRDASGKYLDIDNTLSVVDSNRPLSEQRLRNQLGLFTAELPMGWR